ncbi:MAG: hypothetical protein HJJLKODD_02266 [Phycisphaerae bacterium]|nr:hypothetical protein [Phycisphaerae bacterium]
MTKIILLLFVNLLPMTEPLQDAESPDSPSDKISTVSNSPTTQPALPPAPEEESYQALLLPEGVIIDAGYVAI